MLPPVEQEGTSSVLRANLDLRPQRQHANLSWDRSLASSNPQTADTQIGRMPEAMP
jgi:hypothetical protein